MFNKEIAEIIFVWVYESFFNLNILIFLCLKFRHGILCLFSGILIYKFIVLFLEYLKNDKFFLTRNKEDVGIQSEYSGSKTQASVNPESCTELTLGSIMFFQYILDFSVNIFYSF